MAHAGLAVVFVLYFTEHTADLLVLELRSELLTPDRAAVVGALKSRDKALKALAALAVLVL